MYKKKIKKIVPLKLKLFVRRFVVGSINNFLFNKYNFTMKNLRKLNIGAGGERLLGFINVDIDISTKPEIIRDIEKGLPFDNNSVDEIKCSHTLEHIKDLMFVLREFYRVCKKGARVTITVPLMDASDMTHIRFFDENTFRTLTEKIYWKKPFYFVGKYKEIGRSFKKLSTCKEMTLILEVLKGDDE